MAQIGNLDVSGKSRFEFKNLIPQVRHNSKVVHVNDNDNEIGPVMAKESSEIQITTFESELVDENPRDFLVPFTA